MTPENEKAALLGSEDGGNDISSQDTASPATSQGDFENKFLSAALDIAAKGRPVFPCVPNDKKPLTKNGFKNATKDEQKIREWWLKNPDANIAIPTGNISGLAVIDLDVDVEKNKDGISAWNELCKKHNYESSTFTVKTPRGGRHLYFKYREGFKNTTDKLSPGIDTRGDGGYVLVPPSKTEKGFYEVLEKKPLASVPDFVMELLNPPQKKKIFQQNSIGQADELEIQSALNIISPDISYQNWINVGIALNSWDTSKGLHLWEAWSSRSQKYKAGECQSKWQSFSPGGKITIRTLFDMAYNNGWKPEKKIRGREVESDDKESHSINFLDFNPVELAKQGKHYPCTDAGNAERFFYYNKTDVFYDSTCKHWRVWSGKYWTIDEKETVIKRAIQTVRNIYAEAQNYSQNNQEDKGREILARHALSSESRVKIESMLSLAETFLAKTISELNNDPYLFNCQNGTLDLKTGQLRPHDKADYLTKISPIEYQENSDCSFWNGFIDDVCGGDKDFISFLKKAVGYSLTGDTSEEKFFFAHGRANTGKSTFLESIKSAMGSDYSGTVDFEIFLNNDRDNRIKNSLARLEGIRFVASSEVDDGRALAEGLFKNSTGGDKMTAFHPYGREFEFYPQFKLWLVANHAPRANSSDDAMWRRILKLPFDNVIPAEKRDKTLKAKLKNPAIGGVQVLAWAVKGCLEWQKEGLTIPETVRNATERYRDENDLLKKFFEDVCIFGGNYRDSSKKIYDSYIRYCEENAIKIFISKKMMAEKLQDRNCQEIIFKENGRTKRGWQGIQVLSDSLQTSIFDKNGNPDFSESSKNEAKVTKGYINYTNSLTSPCKESIEKSPGNEVTDVTFCNRTYETLVKCGDCSGLEAGCSSCDRTPPNWQELPRNCPEFKKMEEKLPF